MLSLVETILAYWGTSLLSIIPNYWTCITGVCAIRYMPILNQEGYVELYHVAMAKLGLSENIDFASRRRRGCGWSNTSRKSTS